jgi:hypothetical protein
MRRRHGSITRALLCGLGVLGASACSDWLSDPDATNNPNQPTEANISQLFVSTQTSLTMQYTSDVARTVCMWMQQCAGTDRQYRLLGIYNYGEDAFDENWDFIYTGGGLLDVREVQRLAGEAGDDVYGGIARVMEAMMVGLAADAWGDIPYSDAVGEATNPTLDPQEQVYAAVHAKLDTAITLLTSAQGQGPGAADLYYGGDASKWLRLAHTIKARYHLHLVERQGNSAYSAALSEAQQGLQDEGDDFLGIAAANPQSHNTWYQFIVIQRAGYISPGAFLVNLLQQRNDPRLEEFFDPNGAGNFVGATPGQQVSGTISAFDTDRIAPSFRQPIATWEENALIIAEAAFQTGNTSLALQSVNEVRAAHGLAPLGSVTLADIMTEKYIALFQNAEAWSDWKRTCLPVLTPASGSSAIPGRFYYPSSEQATNPNLPDLGEQPGRNWNDPQGCG